MAVKRSRKLLGKRASLRELANQPAAKAPRRSEGGPKVRGRAVSFLKKEYYLPLPKTKLGEKLNKRRHLLPRYLREAGAELKQTEWPNRRETWKLTFAVFLFAIIFGLVIALVDFGLDKVFRKVLLHS